MNVFIDQTIFCKSQADVLRERGIFTTVEGCAATVAKKFNAVN